MVKQAKHKNSFFALNRGKVPMSIFRDAYKVDGCVAATQASLNYISEAMLQGIYIHIS